MKKGLIIGTALTAALLITGCEQSNNLFNLQDESAAQVTMAEEEVASLKSAEATDSDATAACFSAHVFKGKMQVGGNQLFLGRNFPPCASVTVDGDDFPKTITIDYAEGCTGRMGLEKKGVVTITMSDTILNEGAVYTITFSDMIMGRKTVDRTVTLTNLGTNDDGSQVFSYEMTSTTTFEKNDETFVIVRELTGIRTWLAGFDTPGHEDDIFLKEGSGTITVNDSLTFTKEIVEAILIDRSCKYPLSGIVEITKGDEVMSIDYGTGECDNLALVTKDGVSEEIELDSCKFRDGFKRAEKHMKKKKGWW